MKTNYQNKNLVKLTESDINRIAKKVLQSEQAIPEIGQAKDFFAGLKGIYSGKGYLPSKFSSSLERIGKTFMKDWESQENLISYLYNVQEKIQKSSMSQEKKDKLSDAIDDFITVREVYQNGIKIFLDTTKE